ncbi:hypothetical protein OK351_11480 [Glutamicibacter sp. MNS18]|uniref:hypothetical protein n=1 Tax=Glutamicibacter sp. MNS18 TaxID=2989817 RepID=UPI0022366330|nr:hypothetical protein [Glutamicibacter sp. MNS18]MCW4466119.1 hypothetical protein [Glutamicibacter sp. MNS18]
MHEVSEAVGSRNTFVFWQRSYSIDRAALIAQLAQNPDYRVVLVAQDTRRRQVGFRDGTGIFGAAEIVAEPDQVVVEELAALPAEDAVHLVEGAAHEIWNNEAVIESWIRWRPRVVLLEESWTADGGAGRRHTRALRSLSRLGGRLIAAVLVAGSHSAYEFARLGFGEVFPFNHFTESDRPELSGSPAGQQCTCMVTGEQVNGGKMMNLMKRPRGVHHVGSMRRASHQSGVAVPSTLGHAQPESINPGAVAVAEAELLASALEASQQKTELAAVWTTSQLSADSGAGYLESILKYLDHPETARPQAPWQSSVKVRYRRAQ